MMNLIKIISFYFFIKSTVGQAPGLLKLGGNMHDPIYPNKYNSLATPFINNDNFIKLQISSTEVLYNDEEIVTVKYENTIEYKDSWLGYYCEDDVNILDAKDVNSYIDFVNIDFFNNKVELNINIKMMSARLNYCQFKLYTTINGSSYKYVSQIIKIINAKEVISNIHLAVTSKDSEMRVDWVTAVSDSSIQYVIYDKLDHSNNINGKYKAMASCKTYTNTDMCELPATSPIGFVEPGYLCTAVMVDLDYDINYKYKITNNNGVVYTDDIIFKSNPNPKSHDVYSFIVYADMGTWVDSIPTAKISQAQVTEENVRIIHHIGDISYARGVSSVWDVWFDLIEPYASVVPYMISVGNHEYDHDLNQDKDPSGDENFKPDWWNGYNDSGGECSVPLFHRFNMPDDGNTIYWYSFNYASVHTIVLSSEHNCTKGSAQYTFLEHNLKSVNRTETPWILVEMHRPMYNNEAFQSDYDVSVGMQGEFEQLLIDYNVDLVLAGHYHAYLRTKRIYKDKHDNINGIVHITIGSAGAEADNTTLYEKDWVETFNENYGIGKITVTNDTHLYWEFIESYAKDETGKYNAAITDSCWIVKKI